MPDRTSRRRMGRKEESLISRSAKEGEMISRSLPTESAKKNTGQNHYLPAERKRWSESPYAEG